MKEHTIFFMHAVNSVMINCTQHDFPSSVNPFFPCNKIFFIPKI